MAATQLTVRADEHVHRLYAQHAGLPVGVVTQCAVNHGTMVQAAWHELSGTTFAERAEAFYGDGEECLFDLLGRATTRAERRQRCERDGSWATMLAAGANVLDFGGGLGLTSSLLAEADKRVTYLDVEGATTRFASWFFDAAGQRCDLELLAPTARDSAAALAGRTFDLVLAEHVLEYVADPVATVEALASATASDGGVLLVTIEARPANASEPHRRALQVDELLQGSVTLRAMRHEPGETDGQHRFTR